MLFSYKELSCGIQLLQVAVTSYSIYTINIILIELYNNLQSLIIKGSLCVLVHLGADSWWDVENLPHPNDHIRLKFFVVL